MFLILMRELFLRQGLTNGLQKADNDHMQTYLQDCYLPAENTAGAGGHRKDAGLDTACIAPAVPSWCTSDSAT